MHTYAALALLVGAALVGRDHLAHRKKRSFINRVFTGSNAGVAVSVPMLVVL